MAELFQGSATVSFATEWQPEQRHQFRLCARDWLLYTRRPLACDSGGFLHNSDLLHSRHIDGGKFTLQNIALKAWNVPLPTVGAWKQSPTLCCPSSTADSGAETCALARNCLDTWGRGPTSGQDILRGLFVVQAASRRTCKATLPHCLAACPDSMPGTSPISFQQTTAKAQRKHSEALIQGHPCVSHRTALQLDPTPGSH